jgi:hypothetical protein
MLQALYKLLPTGLAALKRAAAWLDLSSSRPSSEEELAGAASRAAGEAAADGVGNGRTDIRPAEGAMAG